MGLYFILDNIIKIRLKVKSKRMDLDCFLRVSYVRCFMKTIVPWQIKFRKQ